MGGGRWKQHPRSGERKTLERLEAHESIEAVAWVTPGCGQRTPARCQTLEPSSKEEIVEARTRNAKLHREAAELSAVFEAEAVETGE